MVFIAPLMKDLLVSQSVGRSVGRSVSQLMIHSVIQSKLIALEVHMHTILILALFYCYYVQMNI